ncbi:MAG: disulfide bond formation protein B [Betaproteobacteria bacterium HGW-Betaproteobacteria-11]|nr:MAG: disulfide bond formation protein B [Betaproteobacteria bacterium HGW-Betaproteobacteria-11]
MKPRSSPRFFFAVVGLASSGLVGGGLLLAHSLNLAACPLCILQRMLYLLLAALALLAWPFATRPGVARLAGTLIGLAALVGAGIAAYQTWLQRFAKGVSCTADQPWWEQFVDWAGQQVPLLFEATGLCSEAGWKFLGLSIAEWSLLAFSAFALAALHLMLRPAR